MMIKKVRGLRPSALISADKYRNYVESFESETVRGIATLCVLNIIRSYGGDGIYGYQILKELDTRTNSTLMIEEGRLYPLLKNLEHWGTSDNEISLVSSDRKKVGNRSRKYYTLTPDGQVIYNHLEGIFARILQSVAEMFQFQFKTEEKGVLYCPNCANKIELIDHDVKFCEMCGLNILDYKERITGGKVNDAE